MKYSHSINCNQLEADKG